VRVREGHWRSGRFNGGKGWYLTEGSLSMTMVAMFGSRPCAQRVIVQSSEAERVVQMVGRQGDL
jgi:hypothetical protein